MLFNYEQALAEYVFMALLSLRRDLMRCDKSLRISNWGTGDPVPDIAGSTLGVEEFGGIGRALIVPCRSFQMNIIGVTAQNSVGAPPEGENFLMVQIVSAPYWWSLTLSLLPYPKQRKQLV